jgi:hypothetical protein
MSPERRVVIALKVLAEVRENIEDNGGKYSGAMAPNLQSITDVLTLPGAFLDSHLTHPTHRRFLPELVEEAELVAAWAGGPH